MIDIFEFVQFSFYVALISSIIKTLIVYIKLVRVALNDRDEYDRFKQFNELRTAFIIAKNSTTKIILSKLLYFVPGHTLMLNGAFIFNILKYDNTYGIIKGIIASERLSFIPLIKFKTKLIYK